MNKCVVEKEDDWRMKCPATGNNLFVSRDGRWTFNGDYVNPTFNPSINETGGGEVNHYFIRDGYVQYLSDCTHAMAGKTVRIPVLTDAEQSFHWGD